MRPSSRRPFGAAVRGALVAAACVLAALVAVGPPGRAQRAPGAERSAEAAPATTVEAIEVATLASPALALAPHGRGVAALTRDGRLVHATEGGARSLATGLDGEVLVACGETLLAVTDGGTLLATTAAAGSGVDGRGIDARRAAGPAVELHATPACLPDGGVLAVSAGASALVRLERVPGGGLRVVARVPLAVLPDAEPVPVGDGAWAVPIDPTLRYRNGLLGDEVEAGGVAVVAAEDLRTVARWDAPAGRAVEQRRVAAWPAVGDGGLVVTVSGASGGGALAVVKLAYGAPPAGMGPVDTGPAGASGPHAGPLVASAPGLRAPGAWRHVLGASGPRLYAVAAPHDGGPLERWTLPGAPDDPRDGGPVALRRETYALDVTSHVLGRRELDLGRLLPRAPGDPTDVDVLLLPSRDLETLRLVACDADGCRVAADAPLPAPLSTAPWATRSADGGTVAWAALEDGRVVRAAFAAPGAAGVGRPGDGNPSGAE